MAHDNKRARTMPEVAAEVAAGKLKFAALGELRYDPDVFSAEAVRNPTVAYDYQGDAATVGMWLAVLQGHCKWWRNPPPWVNQEWRTREFILAHLSTNGELIRFLDKKDRDENALRAVTSSGAALCHVGPGHQGNKGVVLAAVKQWGASVRFASAAMQADTDVLAAAMNTSRGRAIVHAAEPLRFLLGACRAPDSEALSWFGRGFIPPELHLQCAGATLAAQTHPGGVLEDLCPGMEGSALMAHLVQRQQRWFSWASEARRPESRLAKLRAHGPHYFAKFNAAIVEYLWTSDIQEVFGALKWFAAAYAL